MAVKKSRGANCFIPKTPDERDEIYVRAVKWVDRNKRTSPKKLAHAIGIGERTARTMLDRMEVNGIISLSTGKGGRPRTYIEPHDRLTKHKKGLSPMQRHNVEMAALSLFGGAGRLINGPKIIQTAGVRT